MIEKTVRILGTHGVPAAYGGFETAAEQVGLYLVQAGWRVVVYCQVEGRGPMTFDTWRGIERVNIPIETPGWLGTSLFDLKGIRHAVKYPDVCLSFGYNTAVFNVVQRMKGIPLVINMDGIEWSRARWGKMRQAILYTNERIACLIGNTLIADHPEIETYLARKAPRRKIETVTYGAHSITEARESIPRDLGLEPGAYATLICRPIPENSVLELVRAFSARPRGKQLAILGDYRADTDPYHRAVRDAASDEVIFLGAIYDQTIVSALRFHSTLYLHGHTVGGTNPSLVEAMGARNPILAHDNRYNRWTAGPDAAVYFTDSSHAARILDSLLGDPARLARMSGESRVRFEAEFTWEHVAGQYEEILTRYLVETKGGRR